MITYKTGILTKKEQDLLQFLCHEIVDAYRDVYITKNNLRLFIKDNLNVLVDDIKKGDKLAYNDQGLAVVTGFADKANRKYLKILCKETADAVKYIKVLCWNIDCDLYIKVKRNNPLKDVLQKNGFVFKGGRGTEVLLVRYHKQFSVRKGESNDSGNNQRKDQSVS